MYWLERAFPEAKRFNFRDFHAEYDGSIVVINGAADPPIDMHQLNTQLNPFKWVLLVMIGDEASRLRLDWIEHPCLSIWEYDAKPGKLKYHPLPAGPIQVPFVQSAKTLDWFVSGSIRDINWDREIRGLRGNGLYYPHHLGYQEYGENLAASVCVPCRPSWTSPETCRIYDALESGSIPIVGIYPGEDPPGHCWWRGYNYDWDNFWLNLFGEQPPFPVIRTPNALQDAVNNTVREWPENGRRVHAWWEDYKTRLIESLRAEVKRLQCL